MQAAGWAPDVLGQLFGKDQDRRAIRDASTCRTPAVGHRSALVARRIGRILMAHGRDATDTALSTSFGPTRLDRFEVICEEVG